MRDTLPPCVRNWPWSLDVIRKVIRRTPALQQLGVRVGANKVYSPEEIALIRAALERREVKCAG